MNTPLNPEEFVAQRGESMVTPEKGGKAMDDDDLKRLVNVVCSVDKVRDLLKNVAEMKNKVVEIDGSIDHMKNKVNQIDASLDHMKDKVDQIAAGGGRNGGTIGSGTVAGVRAILNAKIAELRAITPTLEQKFRDAVGFKKEFFASLKTSRQKYEDQYQRVSDDNLRQLLQQSEDKLRKFGEEVTSTVDTIIKTIRDN